MEIKFHKANEVKACDSCDAQEGRHYCLLHSLAVKNMDLKYCDDWEQKDNGKSGNSVS